MTREEYVTIRETNNLTQEQLIELVWEYYVATNTWEELRKFKTKDEFTVKFLETVNIPLNDFMTMRELINYSQIFWYNDKRFNIVEISLNNEIIKIL